MRAFSIWAAYSSHARNFDKLFNFTKFKVSAYLYGFFFLKKQYREFEIL